MSDAIETGGRRGPIRTILAVDDSRVNLNVLGARLGDQGYLMMLSDSGREALDLISARGIDLVLLDMVMPGVSGIDVLTELRGSRDTADLPVIMVTARSEPSAAVEALAVDLALGLPLDLAARPLAPLAGIGVRAPIARGVERVALTAQSAVERHAAANRFLVV